MRTPLSASALLFLAFLAGPVLSQEDHTPIPESVRETPVVRAVREVSDSVVSIQCALTVHGTNPWFGDFTEEIPQGQGSGVIYDKDGLVVTNYHVVFGLENDPNAKIYVKLFKPHKKYPAEIVTFDKDHDIAVLRVLAPKGTVFHPIPMGTSSDLMIGETVIAIGNPFGQDHTVTVGVLSAKNRTIKVTAPDGRARTFKGLLQTDAAINPGNSGGALVNLTGKLIGINNAIRRFSQGIGYAIPVDTVKRVLDNLLTLDKAGNYWLGMTLQEKNGRLQVASIVRGGPAWRSGLRKGDVFFDVGERTVRDQRDFTRAFMANIRNEKIPVRVVRDGRRLGFVLKVGDRLQKFLYEHLGLEAETVPLDIQMARKVQNVAGIPIRSLSAARITHVYPGGPADQAGLKKGDLFLAYQETVPFYGTREFHIYSAEKLAQSLLDRRKGSTYSFMIARDGELYRGSLVLR